MILREIADGLSVVEGGRVDSLLPLLSANLISAERCAKSLIPTFVQVRLTRAGRVWVEESQLSPGTC